MRVGTFPRNTPAVLVVTGAAVYAVVLSVVSVAKYVTFTTEWDHAIFTQYVWLLSRAASPFNTVNGRFLLGDHVEPGLVVLAPLGWLPGTAPALLVAQSLALALVAPILYALGRRVGVDPWLSAVIPLLWLVSPAVVRPNLWEFHPETVAAPIIALSALAAASERWRWFVALAVVACTFREDAALLYVGAGVLLYLDGRRRGGLGLAAGALLWYVTAVLVTSSSTGSPLPNRSGAGIQPPSRPSFARTDFDQSSDAARSPCMPARDGAIHAPAVARS